MCTSIQLSFYSFLNNYFSKLFYISFSKHRSESEPPHVCICSNLEETIVTITTVWSSSITDRVYFEIYITVARTRNSVFICFIFIILLLLNATASFVTFIFVTLIISPKIFPPYYSSHSVYFLALLTKYFPSNIFPFSQHISLFPNIFIFSQHISLLTKYFPSYNISSLLQIISLPSTYFHYPNISPFSQHYFPSIIFPLY